MYNCMFVSALPDPTCNSEKSANGGNKQILLLLLLLLLLYPPSPYSILGYNRTIACTKINVLINIGPGAGGGWKRKGKKGRRNLPNTFDDDCRLAYFS